MINNISKVILLAGAAIIGSTLIPVSANAQGALQTISVSRVDVIQVSSGYRTSKIVGSTVLNETSDTIGKVDDLIVGGAGDIPYVVISVGGFLGVGDRLVLVPLDSLNIGENTILVGASKDELKALPEFTYAAK
jgi:hypothetical protein